MPADGEGEATITASELARRLERGEEIVLLDVCLAEDVERRTDMIPGDRFLRPEQIGPLADELPKDRPVVVYCIYGFQVSGEATAELRRRGIEARRLAGGLATWHAMAGPVAPLGSPLSGEAA